MIERIILEPQPLHHMISEEKVNIKLKNRQEMIVEGDAKMVLNVHIGLKEEEMVYDLMIITFWERVKLTKNLVQLLEPQLTHWQKNFTNKDKDLNEWN